MDSALADVRCIKIWDWESSLTVIITLIEDGNEEAKLPESQEAGFCIDTCHR